MLGRLTRPLLAVALLASFGPLAAHGREGEGKDKVPPARLEKLRSGVNLSHWFSQWGDYSEQRLRTWITPADLRLIRSAGLTHVRFPIDPAILWDESDPAKLKPAMLAQVDRALGEILDSGLAVVVDMHPSDDFKADLKRKAGHKGHFAAFWRSLAGHLAGLDPERVFLEVLNEPFIDDPDGWRSIQGDLLKAMREAAPRHTLIATGDRWSAVDRLEKLQPYDDPNIVYTFHDYEPHNFTHQGATWGPPEWKALHGLPYPGSPEALKPVLPAIDDDRSRAWAEDYGRQHWDAAKIDALIGRAAAWGKEHDVPLYCGEFGVYRQFAPPESRQVWLRDTVRALESHGIGWAMWDYAGGFNLALGRPGERRADEATVKALGSKP